MSSSSGGPYGGIGGGESGVGPNGAEPSQLEFRGRDAEECEKFIHAVSRQALAAGKQRDDQWLADFAVSCFTGGALRWWGGLDERTQSSWRSLRQAMLSRYRPLFHGRSGEEAEEFVYMVQERALDVGKQQDNEWIAAFISSCFVGDALRWYALLDSDVQDDWKRLRKAILTQYRREDPTAVSVSTIPTPAATGPPARATVVLRQRGRIRVAPTTRSPPYYYISKKIDDSGYVILTANTSEALHVEYYPVSKERQALHIPDPNNFYRARLSNGRQNIRKQLRVFSVYGVEWCVLPTISLYCGLPINLLEEETESAVLQFRGKDAQECEEFISAVMKHARDQGRLRDDEWIADLVATCMTHDALPWWSALDEEYQASWKKLRQAMFYRYQPKFYGKSGEEAEEFVHAVRRRVRDAGKQEDDKWITTIVYDCFVGDALRWYLSLDPSVRLDWEMLQVAILIQWPREGGFDLSLKMPTPAPAAAPKLKRGRVRLSMEGKGCFYLCKTPDRQGLRATASSAEALVVDYNPSVKGPQALHIPYDQTPNFDILGACWNTDDITSRDKTVPMNGVAVDLFLDLI
ncbi:hypothetical protein FS837_004366 [Tulasnella sp. UAMH 9824]|nr:hypothetical protein FS837_004366 [Tulasnella sp. UAMH 9824]